MMTVTDLLAYLDQSAPFAAAADWDAVGLQIGDPSAEITRAAVCHEVTRAVVEHLTAEPCEVLVSYHSLLFEPTRTLIAGETAEGLALDLARLGVALVVVHTAFDCAEGGVAEALASALELNDIRHLAQPGDERAVAIGRIGTSSDHVQQLGERASSVLSVRARVAVAAGLHGADAGLEQRVAVVPGSGSGFIEAATAEGATVLVTGDVSHHRAQQALAQGLSLIDAGHIPTERPGMVKLVELVAGALDVVDLTHLDPHPWESTDG
ncbi:MAG: Nif3-like dinuclear metal center hexameric protein [Acidimicrobiia bacterium]|nr:Nif3-like dinuclear metal center hexameric protein [Acidimicrobiia bacterium]